jgi:periplasmic protein TonB
LRTILSVSVVLMALASVAAGQDQTVYQTGNDVKTPVLVHEVKPQYTEAAIRRKVQGVVETKSVILADGTVGDVVITRSLDEDLDKEAIKAIKQWTFKPGTKDGQPVAVQVNIELSFTLRDKR